MNVYVASKSHHGALWRQYRESWRDVGVNVISTWIDESGPGQTSDVSDLWLRCIAEASACDFLVALHVEGEQWKGAYIEIGAALASGKPVFVVGHHLGSWMNHPLVTVVSDPDDAVDYFLRGAA